MSYYSQAQKFIDFGKHMAGEFSGITCTGAAKNDRGEWGVFFSGPVGLRVGRYAVPESGVCDGLEIRLLCKSLEDELIALAQRGDT